MAKRPRPQYLGRECLTEKQLCGKDTRHFGCVPGQLISVVVVVVVAALYLGEKGQGTWPTRATHTLVEHDCYSVSWEYKTTCTKVNTAQL